MIGLFVGDTIGYGDEKFSNLLGKAGMKSKTKGKGLPLLNSIG